MKKQSLVIKLFFCILFIVSSICLKAQSEVVNFIKGGIADGEKLIQAYLEPLGDAMGANLNAGWYNTAKVHNTFGFDITLTITAAFPPESAKTFDLSKIGLRTLELKDPANSIAPTFAGKRDKGPVLIFRDAERGLTLVEFESIGGLDVPLYPLPMIKGAIGLPKGIEVMGRFIPKYSYEDMSIRLWGAGLKYDFLQHIPALNRVPFLHASVMGAYTIVNSTAGVYFQKSIYEEHAQNIELVGGRENYDNQEIQTNMKGFTGALLVSYDLPVIAFYSGVGYSRAMTNVDLLGYYPLISGLELDQGSGQEIIRLEDINNPVSLSFDNFSGLQYVIGLRAKIAIVSVHVDYTRANYNLFTVGAGITLR